MLVVTFMSQSLVISRAALLFNDSVVSIPQCFCCGYKQTHVHTQPQRLKASPVHKDSDRGWCVRACAVNKSRGNAFNLLLAQQ